MHSCTRKKKYLQKSLQRFTEFCFFNIYSHRKLVFTKFYSLLSASACAYLNEHHVRWVVSWPYSIIFIKSHTLLLCAAKGWGCILFNSLLRKSSTQVLGIISAHFWDPLANDPRWRLHCLFIWTNLTHKEWANPVKRLCSFLSCPSKTSMLQEEEEEEETFCGQRIYIKRFPYIQPIGTQLTENLFSVFDENVKLGNLYSAYTQGATYPQPMVMPWRFFSGKASWPRFDNTRYKSMLST